MISKEEILNLAILARLKLSDGEVESLQKDISNILEYVETVSTVEIPQSSALRDKDEPILRNVMRDDAPRLADDALAGKEEALRSAFPKQKNGHNVVRKIIQKDE